MLILTSVLLAWWHVSTVPRAVQPTALPLSVEAKIGGPEEQSGSGIYVTVRNTGPRTITAWGVSAEVKYPKGIVAKRGHTNDRFELSPERFLRPEGTATTQMGIPPPPASALMTPIPTDVIAVPTAVIFDDGTALGDEGVITYLFSRRELHRRVWAALERALADSKSSPDSLITLRAAEVQFESDLDSELRNTASYNEIQRTMATAFEAGGASKASEVLQRLRQRAPIGRAAAAAHSQRR
jgi:hypothetical protein